MKTLLALRKVLFGLKYTNALCLYVTHSLIGLSTYSTAILPPSLAGNSQSYDIERRLISDAQMRANSPTR